MENARPVYRLCCPYQVAVDIEQTCLSKTDISPCNYYHHRIETLQSDAETEGFAVNNVSEENFWSFIEIQFPCPYPRRLNCIRT